MRYLLVCLLVGMLSSLSGCGNGMPQTVKVTGKVTFDGKAPPGPGIVYFLPMEAAAGLPLRPATGDFGADGFYRTTTFEKDDGVMPGKYKMYIECWEQEPNMEGKAVKSHVPKKYQSAETAGFELDVTKATKAKELNLDLATK